MTDKFQIMIESLDKKIDVLKRINSYNEQQEVCFSKDTPDIDSFDKAIQEKELLIQELNLLDSGFETLYNDIRLELSTNSEMYRKEIAIMKDQIRIITDLTNSAQTKEARNKRLIEDYFRASHATIRQNRQQSKAALDYYKSMSGLGTRQFGAWDSKQ